jgi:hypothetical protein
MDELEFILETAIQNPQYRPMFYEKLMSSDVFVVTDYNTIVESNSLNGKKKNIFIKTLRKENGMEIIPFFTTVDKLTSFTGEDTPYINLRSFEFFDIIKGNCAVINPGSEVTKEFTFEEIKALINGTLFVPQNEVQFEKDSEVTVFTPVNYPEELADRLNKLFSIEGDVVKAYLLQYERGGNDGIKYMVAVETEGSFERIAGKAIITAEGSVAKGVSIDFVEMDNDSGIKVGIEGDFQPFYERK